MRTTTRGVAVTISGTQGQIEVLHPANCPTSLIVYGSSGGEGKRIDFELPKGAQGFFYEADAVARCIRDGKTECEYMPLEESLMILEAADTVRCTGGLRYPESVERTAQTGWEALEAGIGRK